MDEKRLLKLAAFLDKLPRKKFDFSIVREERKCGTVACAMGWTPTVFPTLVRSFQSEWIALRGVALEPHSLAQVARELFGIDEVDAKSLFIFGEGPWLPGGWLPHDPTPKQVAASIRRFVKWKKAVAK